MSAREPIDQKWMDTHLSMGREPLTQALAREVFADPIHADADLHVSRAATDDQAELDVLTTRQICELPDPPESDKLLGDFVVRGHRIVVGGHSGEGKTTISLQIVRAIVTGEEFLEWTGADNLRALIVDAEQGLRTVKRRLHEAGLDQSDAVDYLRVPDGMALDRDTAQALALQDVLENGQYAVVVLDPLYKLHAGDSNVERGATDLMKIFDSWRDRYRFALLLPVHLRKPIPGERFSIHDVFGSSAYVRGAEIVLGIRRVSHGYAELHFFKDRDGDLEVGARWACCSTATRASAATRKTKSHRATSPPRSKPGFGSIRAPAPTRSRRPSAPAKGPSPRHSRTTSDSPSSSARTKPICGWSEALRTTRTTRTT